MSDRDFAVEMRAIIDAETSASGYMSRLVANDIVAKLEANDPELLDGWLRAHAETLIWAAINTRDRSLRTHARQTANAGRFAAAAEAAEDGDMEPLQGFLSVPYVVQDGSRKRLADLTKDDLLFVAARYDVRAKENALNAAFARALAKKVGKGVVSDHFDDNTLATMWTSLGGK